MLMSNMYAELAVDCDSMEEFLRRASERSYNVYLRTDFYRGWHVTLYAWWSRSMKGGWRPFRSSPVGSPLPRADRAEAEAAALACLRESAAEEEYGYGDWVPIRGKSVLLGTITPGGDWVPADDSDSLPVG
jgi:hypothetical protein